MEQNLSDDIGVGGTSEVEGQTEPESELGAGEDAMGEVSPASGSEVAADAGAGLEEEGVSESSASDGVRNGAEGGVSSETTDSEVPPEESPPDEVIEVKSKSEKGWYVCKYEKLIAVIVFVLSISFVVFGVKHWRVNTAGEPREVISTLVYRASITSNLHSTLDFSPFIILFPDDHERTYLSLTISVKLADSNINIYKEIQGKKTLLRGVIYEVLNKAIKAAGTKMMSREQLKRDIISDLNRLLVNGIIDDVYFTNFLVV